MLLLVFNWRKFKILDFWRQYMPFCLLSYHFSPFWQLYSLFLFIYECMYTCMNICVCLSEHMDADGCARRHELTLRVYCFAPRDH